MAKDDIVSVLEAQAEKAAQDIIRENAKGSCWLFHKWTPWKVVGQGSIERMVMLSGEARVNRIGQYCVQQRQCVRCQKIELDKQTVNVVD